MNVLTCAEVAERLRISQKQAAIIMKELPSADCSGDVRSTYKTMRIAESVLDGYILGKIKRTPRNGRPLEIPLQIPKVQPDPPRRGGAKRYDGPVAYR